MKQTLLLLFLVLAALRVQGQINMADSTVQVIGYWDMGESETYSLTFEELKIQQGDTISRYSTRSIIDIVVVDSTANSYTMDWNYRDYEVLEADAKIKEMTELLSHNITVRVKTNEMGQYPEIVNMDEMMAETAKIVELVMDEYKGLPEFELIEEQVNKVMTKEYVEGMVMEEITQLYAFHGNRYKLGEEYGNTVPTQSPLTGTSLTLYSTTWLDEINPENNNYIMRMVHEVDKDELTKTTLDYLNSTIEAAGGGKLLTREDIGEMENTTWTASRIHNWGWPIYSIITKEVSNGEYTNIKQTIIELQ